MKISAIVPLKKNSRRLKNKNFLNLDNQPLYYHIFNTLINIPQIKNVYCYTSSTKFLKFLPNEVLHLKRPKRLDKDSVQANELFRYCVEKVNTDYILISHATNPFINKSSIIKGINAIKSKKYDSSMSVLKHQTYSWFKRSPLNYDPYDMSQTQDLQPLYTETSGFYIFKRKDYLNYNTRISKKPFLVEITQKEAIDIDELKDYNLSKKLVNYNENEKNNIFDLVFLNNLPSKKLKKFIKHIAFDLDGVLIDSLNLMENSWKSVNKKTKINIPFSNYKNKIGLPFFEILKNLKIDKKKYDKIYELYSNFSSENINLVKVYKGIYTLLDILVKNKFKISIVTSKDKKRTQQIISKFFSKYKFASVITPDDIKKGRGKPNPDSLYLSCIKCGVSIDETIYIGDMEADFILSQRANVKFIHAKWGYGFNNFNSISVRNVNEIIKLIDNKNI